ncbi:hypothetical protein HMSSN036_48980 [Paenibacillus macerans]|nr:hypothetical protein HMSSN036_48980 [Paenibacillus macerans]
MHTERQKASLKKKAFIKDGKKTGNYILQSHWVELYKVEQTRSGLKFILIDNPPEVSSILDSVYRKNYSINNIINQINNRMTGDFIKEVVFNGFPFIKKDQFLRNLRNLPLTRTRTFLSKELSLINDALDERKKRN